LILHDVFVIAQSFYMSVDSFVPLLQIEKRLRGKYVLASFIFYL